MFKIVTELLLAWLRCLACCVLVLFAAGVSHAGLVAEYRFEENSYSGAAAEVIDTSGAFRHGRVVGSASSTGSGRTCRGLNVPIEFGNGSNAMDTGLDVNTALGNAGSISFWYYSTSQEYANRVLFDATTSSGARFMLYRDDNSLIAGNRDVDLTFVATDSGGVHRSTSDIQLFADYTWTHITITWNFTSGFLASSLRIYVDGSLQDSRSFTASGGALNSGIGTLYFGDNRSTASAVVLSSGGVLDSIRLFDHALSASEVTTEFNRSHSCTYLHHLRLETASTSAAQDAPTTFTVRACANASCSVPWTGGVSGTLTLSGAGVGVTYPSGSSFSISAGNSTTTVIARMSPSGSVTAGLTSLSTPPSTAPSVYCGFGVTPAAGNSCTLPVVSALHHVRLSSVATGLTCAPHNYTITACANADCSALHTGGLSGNLSISGGNVNYPAGAGFVIAAGSSSTVVQAQLTQVATYTAGLGSLSITPSASPPVYCGMGTTPSAGGSCSQTMAEAGLLFDVPDHSAESSHTVVVSAVRRSDNSLSCTPAFASTSKTLNFRCSYSNPASGSWPVRVGGLALNGANNVGQACDGSGRNISLNFDANGQASTTVQYADAGRMTLTASYTGSGPDAGLIMNGNDVFVSFPHDFEVSRTGSGTITAGQNFGITVRARNIAGGTTPNFGRESSPESVLISFIRTQPGLAGAVTGTHSSTLAAWSNGQASGTVRYDEVGRGHVAARLSSGNYLSAGKAPAGSTAGSWIECAVEGGTCVLPTGAEATIAYGISGRYHYATAQTGSQPCTNARFGDPFWGAGKRCFYVVTGGTNTTVTGSVGPFVPDHFTVETTQACTAGIPSFTYSGQPFTMTVRARNVAGNTTQNYDGTANTSPNFARAVTLSAATNASLGSLGTTSLSASAFSGGMATLSNQSFTFGNKLTAPASVTLRAIDSDGVSSAGQSEGSVSLRSGRLRMFNKFGSERTALEVPVQAHYWTGKAWIINSADRCTQVSTASVVRARYLDHRGAVTTSWSSSPVGPVLLTNGIGALMMSAPAGGATGTVELAINLGNTSTDQSCLGGTRPPSTGLNQPWLRSVNGSCASTHDRDPSARATFGVHAPETRKQVFKADVY